MKPTFMSQLCGIILIASTLCLISCGHRGQEQRLIYLPASEVHEGWYFAAGQRVTIEGTVNGDAYVAGGIIQIDGKINGDLLVAGGQVTVSGTVTNNIRAAGGNLRIDGNVGRDVTIAGGTITIGKSSSVSGNLLAAGGDLTIIGSVGKEARLSAAKLTVLGSVNGPVSFSGGKLEIAPGARIQGDLHVAVKDTADMEIAAGTVQGTIERSVMEKSEETHILGASPFAFWFSIYWIVSLLVTGLVLVLLFPAQVTGTATAVLQRPGASSLFGIIGLVTIPIAVVLLLATLVAAPVALIVLFFYFLLLYLSQLALGVAVGDRIFHLAGRHTWQLYLPVAAGILIVQLLALVPFLRILIILAEIILGFGALLYYIWKEYKSRRMMPA